LAAAGLFVLGGAIWFFVFAGSETESSDDSLGMLDSESVSVGEPAPDFVLRDARDSRLTHRLSDFRGDPVILNWYATWCLPCRLEIPEFVEASESLDGRFTIVGVNLQESPEKAVGLLEQFGASYVALLDQEGEVAERYRVTGMPTTYFIDEEGNVAWFKIGQIGPKELQQGLDALGIEYAPD
jgi:cytochrome c biogenesis protein CcmG, thiol:disulfide interchange protein DsbE